MQMSFFTYISFTLVCQNKKKNNNKMKINKQKRQEDNKNL